MKKATIFIVIGLTVLGGYVYFSKPWQLSLYGEGVTLMRIDYDSRDACLSAGNSYYRDGSTQYKRFDCGYKCKYVGSKDDLTNSPECSSVCDNYGCK